MHSTVFENYRLGLVFEHRECLLDLWDTAGQRIIRDSDCLATPEQASSCSSLLSTTELWEGRDKMEAREECVEMAERIGAVGHLECSSLEGWGVDEVVSASLGFLLGEQDEPHKQQSEKQHQKRCLVV